MWSRRSGGRSGRFTAAPNALTTWWARCLTAPAPPMRAPGSSPSSRAISQPPYRRWPAAPPRSTAARSASAAMSMTWPRHARLLWNIPLPCARAQMKCSDPHRRRWRSSAPRRRRFSPSSARQSSRAKAWIRSRSSPRISWGSPLPPT